MTHARAAQINRTVSEIKDAAMCPLFPPRRVLTVHARQLLLAQPFFVGGEMYRLKCKSLGAGVYEVTREKTK